MKTASSYRELVVWKKAVDLVVEVHRLIREFPPVERYRLTDQLARSVVSVPANIAEGCGRGSAKDYARFISIAKGSTLETEALLIVSHRLGYIGRDEIDDALERTAEISKMLASLRRHLRAQSHPRPS